MVESTQTAGRCDVPRAPRPPLGSAGSFLASLYFCLFCLVYFLLASDRTAHWFIIPVVMCGVLIGSDAADWFRGRLDLFDPVGILGLLGVHFFFLAPLLHVHWDYWMSYVVPPPDWRDYLGGMAILNFLGLLVYRYARQLIKAPSVVPGAGGGTWSLEYRTFAVLLLLSLALTGVLQACVYARYGGVLGYISSYEEGEGAFEGMGWVFMISESFPILAMIGYATLAAHRGMRPPSWAKLSLVLLGFFVLKMLFGGLRGSRSNTIWGLFWAAGIIHLSIRPISKKLVICGLLFIILFMYIYGFYKSAGMEGLATLQEGGARTDLELKTGRTLSTTILGDLARSDVQAYLLYKMIAPSSDYQFALGRTYIGSIALLIPKGLWPNRPNCKDKEGTEAQYGMGTYQPGVNKSSRVYGLAGEAMLNFGPLSVPLSFAILGLVVGRVCRWLRDWGPGDPRLLLGPFLVNFCFIVMAWDSDNMIFNIVKNGS